MGYHVMTLTERGEAAEQRGDHAKAAQYYLALAKAGSDVAVGFSRACAAFAAAGQRENALAACRDALSRPGVRVEDAIRFVNLTLKKDGALAPGEVSEVEEALAQLSEKVGQTERGSHTVTTLRCQLAVRLEDEARLASCVDAVAGWSPSNVSAFVFRSLYALKQERWQDLHDLIADAQRADIPADVIRRTQESMEARKAWLRETRPNGPGVGWIVGGSAVLAALLSVFMNRRTLRAKPA
jgi:hypothetical protein